MPTDNPKLQQWWDGLTKQERAEAIRSYKSGRLSDATAQSLQSAGISPMPSDVGTFLKTRHD